MSPEFPGPESGDQDKRLERQQRREEAIEKLMLEQDISRQDAAKAIDQQMEAEENHKDSED